MFDFRELAGMGKKGYEACVAAVAEATVNAEASAFANGDYWNNGAGWVGIELDSSNSTAASAATAGGYTKRIFTPIPITKDILNRWVTGLLGQPYISSATDDLKEGTAETEQEILLELERVQREWAARHDINMPMGKALKSSLYAGDTSARTDGRGLIRFRIPPSFLSDEGLTRSLDFQEAMAISRLEFLPADTAIVLGMDTAAQDGSIHLYTDPISEKKMVEYSYIDTAETVAADGNGAVERFAITRTFQMDEDGKQVKDGGWWMDLGGRLLTFQITHDLLIDDSMLRLQKALNLANTAQTSNLNLGGWVQEFIMNAMPPGQWEVNADGSLKLDTDGQPNFIMAEQVRGAATATYVPGIPIVGPDGEVTGYTTPNRQRDMPVSPATFIEAIDSITAVMLRTAGQGHLNMSSGSSSGIALTYQRRDFYIALSSSKVQVDMMLKWVMETAIALAAKISEDETYSNIRLNVEAVLDTGIITAAELKTLAEIALMNFLPLRTLIQLAGFEPTEQLEMMIEEEMRKQAEILPEDITDGDDAAGETGDADGGEAGDDAE